MDSREYMTLLGSIPKLVEGLAGSDIETVADNLRAESLLSIESYDNITSISKLDLREQAREIVKDVLEKVKVDPKAYFKKFLDVLRGAGYLEKLVQMLEEKYRK